MGVTSDAKILIERHKLWQKIMRARQAFPSDPGPAPADHGQFADWKQRKAAWESEDVQLYISLGDAIAPVKAPIGVVCPGRHAGGLTRRIYTGEAECAECRGDFA